MGLLVNILKVGYGNTNNGNTSCRFFSDINLAATITAVDIELIQRFKIILEVLSTGFDIIVGKVAIYPMDTAMIYVQLYGWQSMSPTVHKIWRFITDWPTLWRGCSGEEQTLPSIQGKLCKEILRDCMQWRRIKNRLLLTSGPLLSSMRQNMKRNMQSFSYKYFFKIYFF